MDTGGTHLGRLSFSLSLSLSLSLLYHILLSPPTPHTHTHTHTHTHFPFSCPRGHTLTRSHTHTLTTHRHRSVAFIGFVPFIKKNELSAVGWALASVYMRDHHTLKKRWIVEDEPVSASPSSHRAARSEEKTSQMMTAEVGPAIGLRTRTGSSALTNNLDEDDVEDDSSTDNDTEPEAEVEVDACSSSSSSSSLSSSSSSSSSSRQAMYNNFASLAKHPNQPSSLLGGSLSATLRNALDLFVSSTPLTETD